MNIRRRFLPFFVNVLLIMGLITAGVSPACKFISGKADLIEICTAEGLQKIAAAGHTSAPVKPVHQMADTCAFCLAAQTHKAGNVTLTATTLPAVKIQRIYFTTLPDDRAEQKDVSSYRSRAPPVFS